MDKIRKPFQGVWNIIRFNWHFYVLAFLFVIILFLLRNIHHSLFRNSILVLGFLALYSTVISLLVSCYVYDFSRLYTLSWLDDVVHNTSGTIVNINAGFDETSSLIEDKFSNASLIVFDFYDAEKHTEISIKRARKAYPSFPDTQVVTTDHLPLKDNSVNTIFAILSAHEIRDTEERILFFIEMNRVLISDGQIVVTEHLRDTANFLAYNIGFFHFHSKKTWLNTFEKAKLQVAHEIKITPFITTFILTRNGTTH